MNKAKKENAGSSSGTRERNQLYTPEEKQVLDLLFTREESKLCSTQRNTIALAEKRAAWKRIHQEYNSTKGCSPRTPFQLRTIWYKMKHPNQRRAERTEMVDPEFLYVFKDDIMSFATNYEKSFSSSNQSTSLSSSHLQNVLVTEPNQHLATRTDEHEQVLRDFNGCRGDF